MEKTKPRTSNLRWALMALLMMLLTTATAGAQEHSGTTTDGLTWKLTEDANGNYTVLTIGGSGAMQNYGYTTVNTAAYGDIWKTKAPWGYDITSVTIGDGVTSIGNYAFIGCENVKSVTIGSSVASIGIGAINHCDQMTTVTLPASVATIGYAAFENCQKLKYVIIEHDGEVSLTGNYDNHFNAPNLQNIVFSSPAAALANTKTEGNWARYSGILRTYIGKYLFQATNEGGTPAYAITDKTDLNNLATIVSDGNGVSGKTFRQTEDITFTSSSSNSNFSGIGSHTGGSGTFCGTYDGGGHTISNLNILTIRNTYQSSGFFNYVDGATIRNVILISPTVKVTINTTNSLILRLGALIGTCRDNDGKSYIENCYVINPTLSINSSGSTTKLLGALVGSSSENTTMTNCYYYGSNSYDLIGHNNGSTLTNVSRARKVTLGDDMVSVSPAATDAANGFVYDGYSYYREGLTLTLDHADRTGYDFSGYSVGGSVIEGNTYDVPTSDVTVKTTWTPSENIALTANGVTEDNVTNYWTTFYCGDAGYKIDDNENACAYTATYSSSTLTLHKLGKVIPAGTAVIIVGEDNEISMTKSTATAEYNVDNDLRGVNARTLKSSLGTGTFYVMGMVGESFGFFQYTGQYMPARKAYLLVSSNGEALVNGFTMEFEDDATGIVSPLGETEEGVAIFNLAGQRLNKMQKGIYIVNGKKILK